VSSQASTTWNFTSAPPPDPTKATGTVPSLLSIGYDADVDGLGRAAAGRPLQIGVRVGHLVHSPSSEITGARLSYSLDGGVGWTPAVVVPTKDGYRAIVPPRDLSPGSSLSLRATATDAAGSSITQTVIGAIPIH
jgi:hypothetical protein